MRTYMRMLELPPYITDCSGIRRNIYPDYRDRRNNTRPYKASVIIDIRIRIDPTMHEWSCPICGAVSKNLNITNYWLEPYTIDSEAFTYSCKTQIKQCWTSHDQTRARISRECYDRSVTNSLMMDMEDSI